MGCEGSKNDDWQRRSKEPPVKHRRLLSMLPDVKRTSGLTIEAAAFYRPKDGSEDGEDSYFIKLPGLGIADGVGGSKQLLGFTSKAFADELMQSCADQIMKLTNESGKENQDNGKNIEVKRSDVDRDSFLAKGASPFVFLGFERSNPAPSWVAKSILCKAFRKVKSFGAATALVAFFDTASNRLGIASVGDSGLMVIRRSTHRPEHLEYIAPVTESENAQNSQDGLKIIFRSPSQQHSFNVPFQVGKYPQEMLSEMTAYPDSPEDSQTYDVEIEEGDLILLFSDGVTDNLNNSEILQICDCFSPFAVHALGLSENLVTATKTIAESIVLAAYKKSGNTTERTPFTEEALLAEWPLEDCIGGKQDDITCTAAWVAHRQH